MHPDKGRYVKACTFPGPLDEIAVERNLAQYLAVLGLQRKITRLGPGWAIENHPSLEKSANDALDRYEKALSEIAALDARASRAAQDARDALAALDATAAREALTVLAARAASDAVGSLGGGICHMHDDEVNAFALDDARDAIALAAPLFTSDELETIAADGVRRTTRDPAFPWPAFPEAARVALAARAAARAASAAHAALPSPYAHAARIPSAARGSLLSDAEPLLVPYHSVYRPQSDAGVALHGVLRQRDDRAVREALDARVSGCTRAALDALRRFSAWCIQASERRSCDLAHVSLGWLGASLEAVKARTRPLFEAYVSGAWLIHWTEDTLFWVAKPRLSLDARRRLHRTDGPAFESDLQDLYFLRGVRVPAFVVTRPDMITLDDIRAAENQEVRRVMVEQYGQSRYLLDSKAEVVHHDDFGTLYRAPVEGDEPLVMVRVVNSTREPDGSYKEYFLRVPPTIRRAREAVAWTFGLQESTYNPEVQT